MSEKDLYKAFNDIIIDEHEFDDIDVSMTDLQKSSLKRDLKNNIKTRKFVKSKIAAACAAALILLLGIGYTNPSFAAQIPILNPIVEIMGHTGDYAKYSEIVNKTVTYNGKSFTINSVTCFDNNIIIGYTVKSDKKIDSTGSLFFPTFKVNGKWLNVGSTGSVKNIDDYTAMGTIELLSTDMILPDNFKFDMSFEKLDAEAGEWDFKFNISKVELKKNTKIYMLNQVVTYDNYNFTIDKVALTPLNTVISLHSESKLPWNWIILDDKGNELYQGSLRGKEFPNDYSSLTSYSKINENTKYLTMIPYKEHAIIDQDSKSPISQGVENVSVPINTKLPIELSEGKNSKVTLTKINFSNDNDYVNIQGIIYGKLPNHQIVALEGDNPKADIRVLNTTIKKIDTDKYEFSREYSGLKNDKNYKLIAPSLDYNIDYDSKITIMLK